MKDCPHNCNDNGYYEDLEPGCLCFSCFDLFPCPIHRPGEKYVSIHQRIEELNQRKGRVVKPKRIKENK